MSNPKQKCINKSEDEQGFGWGGIIAGVTIATATVGGIYLLMYGRSSGNKKEKTLNHSMHDEAQSSLQEQNEYHTGMTITPPEARDKIVSNYSGGGNKSKIIIAIDATPEKCGGFVRFPNEKCIVYYSTTWNPYYKFPRMEGASDKFEMVNALIALTKFENIIQQRMDTYEILTIRIDNSFYKSKYRNDEHYYLRNYIENIEEDLCCEWEQVTKEQDFDIKSADWLSKSENYSDIMVERYPGYILTEVDVSYTMSTIRYLIPSKYHV